MSNTKLLYMEDMQAFECEAYVEKVEDKDGKTVVYLDQTVFYPQGGGQPYDTGTISSGDIKFVVEEVRYAEGEVLHIGRFEHVRFMEGEQVRCTVDAERRLLNTRLHSAGHVLDMAVNELGYDWKPGKGYHFPDGPYVEYQADLKGEPVEAIIAKLDEKISEILTRDIKTEIRFVTLEEMASLCRHVPEYLPKDKPSRVVLYGNFGVPCGGTHVSQFGDIGGVRVRKMKDKDGTLRVSYEMF
ncbi:MAG: alanine--tRNA ligase-related protein [Patescibacteria group bacterium]